MFRKARLKLTVWYLLIIMAISGLFSAVIYRGVAFQLEGLIRLQNERMKKFQQRFNENELSLPPPPPNSPFMMNVEDLNSQKKQLAYTLLFVNLNILAITAAAGYFLAGQTLKPIKQMIDKQNRFITDASHELRTPLAVLKAEMEGKLLEKHISDSSARKLIKSNLEDLNSLQDLADNLLKLSKTDNFSYYGKMTAVSLTEVMKEVHSKMAVLADQKKIKLKLKTKEAVIKGNKKNLIELFGILIDNAVKYSPENSEIKISVTKTVKEAEISVADQGIGIDKKDLPYIFDRFFRADKSRSLAQGYGLGLSIAKKIVLAHKGSIRVESKKNKGSIFRVIFPIS